MTDKPKPVLFCINCKHYNPDFNGQLHRCMNSGSTIDVVLGENKYYDCYSIRSNPEQCGYHGLWFEEKDGK